MAKSKDIIRVLIADDSAVVREVLKDMLEDEPDMQVVGEAQNGREACELCQKLKPDIVTMDVLMPVMDGLQAVEHIMAYSPTPILVFSSAVSNKEMDIAFKAIHRGALDVMEKPAGATGERYETIRKEIVGKLRLLSNIQVIPHLQGKKRWSKDLTPKAAAEPLLKPQKAAAKPETQAKPVPRPLPAGTKARFNIVAVGASTGGPKALVQIFSQLPEGLPAPVLVVQHIAPSFAEGLVEWLNRESKLTVKLAEENEKIRPGIIYVAPTGKHLTVHYEVMHLTESELVNSCRPSVDVLFRSVADSFGNKTLAVLLTGMGRDGADGMRRIHDRRGQTIVQDESTSIIFGMPKAAIDLGAADQVLPLGEIPEAIVQALNG